MEQCKLCLKKAKNLRSLSTHLSRDHNINLIDYKVEFEQFDIPKCTCGKQKKLRKGLVFNKSCGSIECSSSVKSNRVHSDETKNKMRQSRLDYMKNNPEFTSWRTSNKMSWPEKIFLASLEKSELMKLCEIEREKSFYPYYVDFAFINVKVAVEIQGSQHYSSNERILSDLKKKDLILSKGWRVFYIDANQVKFNSEECVKELIEFIGDVNSKVKTSSIITEKEKKDIISNNRRLLKKQEKDAFIKKRIELVLNSNIDFTKFGWATKLSKILGISSQKTSLWVKTHMIDFYKRCFKRK